MDKYLVAVIIAAGCAAILVGLVPPAVPAAAAPPSAERGVTEAKPALAARGVDIGSAGCVQAWPYYEQSCLHDGRRQDGSAGAVRVIAAGQAPRQEQ